MQFYHQKSTLSNYNCKICIKVGENMAGQEKDLRTVIYEQNEIIEKLTYDNRQLMLRLQNCNI